MTRSDHDFETAGPRGSHRGRQRCNDFSIGIELEGCDAKPFTQKQYRRLSQAT